METRSNLVNYRGLQRFIAGSRLILLIAGLYAAMGLSPAWPAEGYPDNFCRNGMFPKAGLLSLALARISAVGKVHFVTDRRPECPNKSVLCISRAYVVSGDIVITGESEGGYVCAYFPNSSGGNAGWISASKLTRLPIRSPLTISAWVGEWWHGDNWIRISVTGDELTAEGAAIWGSYETVVHSGEMGGTARPNGSAATFEDDGCRVEVRLVGPYLIAVESEDSVCGGANVSFNGIYRRK